MPTARPPQRTTGQPRRPSLHRRLATRLSRGCVRDSCHGTSGATIPTQPTHTRRQFDALSAAFTHSTSLVTASLKAVDRLAVATAASGAATPSTVHPSDLPTGGRSRRRVRDLDTATSGSTIRYTTTAPAAPVRRSITAPFSSTSTSVVKASFQTLTGSAVATANFTVQPPHPHLSPAISPT